MLPTGKVMGFDRMMNLRLWDPITNAITILRSWLQHFLLGHFAVGGRNVLVTGGHVDDLTGLPFARSMIPSPTLGLRYRI